MSMDCGCISGKDKRIIKNALSDKVKEHEDNMHSMLITASNLGQNYPEVAGSILESVDNYKKIQQDIQKLAVDINNIKECS